MDAVESINKRIDNLGALSIRNRLLIRHNEFTDDIKLKASILRSAIEISRNLSFNTNNEDTPLLQYLNEQYEKVYKVALSEG